MMKPFSIALILAALSVTPRLHATIVVSADLPELVADARAIVHGRVVATEPRVIDGRRSIETVVTVAADEYLKGNLGPRVSLRVPGGQIGFRRSVVIGAPVFEPGDDVVLFLGGAGPALPWIVGLNQGVYRVRAGSRSIGSHRLFERQVVEGETAQARASGAARMVPLSTFKARVRALVRAEEAR